MENQTRASQKHRRVFAARTVLQAITVSILLLSGCADSHPIRVYDTSSHTFVPAGTSITLGREVVRLRLHHLHTGEEVDVVYRQGSQVVQSSVRVLNHLLRDWRANKDAAYPVAEFDLLHAVMVRLGRPDRMIEVVCGYRSPRTNRFLRAGTSLTGVSVASSPLAIDKVYDGFMARTLVPGSHEEPQPEYTLLPHFLVESIATYEAGKRQSE